MLTTPSGNPASCNSSPSRSAESGVCSAGFSTTVHPAASAGPSFHAAMSSGKFHGMICPTTPTGSRTGYGRNFAGRSRGERNGVAFDLGGPTGVVAHVLDAQRDIRDAGDGQWLAVIQRFELRE